MRFEVKFKYDPETKVKLMSVYMFNHKIGDVETIRHCCAEWSDNQYKAAETLEIILNALSVHMGK